MDHHRFDTLTRALAAGGSRRDAVRALVGVVLVGLSTDDLLALARRRRRDRRSGGRDRHEHGHQRGGSDRSGSLHAEGKSKGKGKNKGKKKRGKTGRPSPPVDPPRAACAGIPLEPGQQFTDCDFAGQNLSGLDLQGASFTNTDLSGANLTGTNLRRSTMIRSKLVRTNLENADLSDATLTESDFSQANLSGANLRNASFDGGTLQGATLEGATMPDGSTGRGGDAGDGGDGGDGCSTTCRPPLLLSANCGCVCPAGTTRCGNECGTGGTGGNANGGSGGCTDSVQCVECGPGEGVNPSSCTCQPCAAGESVCGGFCRDLQTNPNHCGSCGNACKQGNVCTGGECVCPEGGQLCQNGVCKTCPPTFALNTQQCACVCPGASIRCGVPCGQGGSGSGGNGGNSGGGASGCGNPERCVECEAGQSIDPNDCTCVGCPTGHEVCDGFCRNIQTDRNHCGTCGNVCPSGNRCVDGECQCVPGATRCNNGTCGSCPATYVLDPQQCRCECPSEAVQCGGTCGTSGTGGNGVGGTGGANCNPAICVTCGAGEWLDAAMCQCVACPADTHAICGDHCRNLQTNRNHCDACGHSCGPGIACVDGVCACAEASTTCTNGECAVCHRPLTLDPDACSCVCTEGMVECSPEFCGGDGGDANGGDGPVACSARCVPACPPGQALDPGCACVDCPAPTHDVCGGYCRDLQTNRAHCGACGHACSASQMCAGGTCVCPSGKTPCGIDRCHACPATYVVHPSTCNCVCPTGTVHCTPTACGGDGGDGGDGGRGGDGGDGGDGCPPTCVPVCPQGQLLDPATCACA